MSKKITSNNIKNFFQGNVRVALNAINRLDPHIKEQVLYRSSHCADCLQAGKCKNCGCSVPGRWYSTATCGERFPDLMEEQDWEKYKEDNNITI